MSEGNQASEQRADRAPVNASLLGLIRQVFEDDDRPIWRKRMESGGATSEDAPITHELPKIDDVLGDFSNEIRGLWDDATTELKVGAAALAAFGLGVYIGKRTS